MSGTSQQVRRASLGVVLATIAIDALGFGIVAPVMPDLVMQLEAVSGSTASFYMGALLAVFAFMQFLCAPLLGGLSDRFGRRLVLLLSLAGACVSYMLLAWAPSLAWLFVGQAVSGATEANVATANAYIADVTAPAERAQRFGLVGAVFAVGFVLGPAIGGTLGAYGPRVPFVAAAILAGGNALYGLVALSESLPIDRRRRFLWRSSDPTGVLRHVASDRVYRRLAVAWCATWIGFGALQSSFVLANEMRLGWNTRQNGLALVVLGIAAALVQGIAVKRIIARLAEQGTALLSLGLASAAYVSFAFAGMDWMVFLGILLLGGSSMSTPSIQAMVSARAAPDRQGEALGALASLRGLTAIVAPLATGSLFAVLTRGNLNFPGAPFLLAAATYAAAFVAVRGIVPQEADQSSSATISDPEYTPR